MDSASPASLGFKDRKGGLIFFGLATAFLGLLSGLLVPLMIFAARFAPPQPNTPTPPNLASIAALYGVLAVVLIWLGIGSMMARRWARALLAVWSWSWFAMGLIAIVVLALMAPQLAQSIRAAQPAGQPQLSGSAQTMLMLIPAFMMSVLFVILPLIWGLFYGSRNVKATCEARDPVARWTDRCPLPVLAVSLWLGFGALCMLMMPAFHSVAPFFGMLLSGAAGTLYYLGLAAIWAYSAWAIYRLEWRGWWVIFVAMVLFGVSNVTTYSRHDIREVYALMGYAPAQAEQMRALGSFGQSTMTWSTCIFALPFLVYLFYVRKFFSRAAAEQSMSSAQPDY
ncbi:MAG: hypothetical protein ACJ8EL_14020 [Rhizomicrobium sp.]